MKTYNVFQIFFIYLNLFNVSSLQKRFSFTPNNNIIRDKLVLKENLLEDNHSPSRECITNIGTAIDVLQRELPLIFILKDPNFNIFSSQITVVTDNKKYMKIPKIFYIASVKSLQTLALFSKIRPELNVRKIEYIEDSKTIRCLVNIVLPKIINTDIENKWEGYFYFGVNEIGIVNSHIFDRIISNLDVKSLRINQLHFVNYNKICNYGIYNKLKSFLKLMRVNSIPPTFLLCFSGGWIMKPNLPILINSVPFIISTINTLLITSASMVINDIYDVEVDRINSPHRPLVNGEVTMKEAYLLTFLLLGGTEYLTFKFLSFNLQMIIQLAIFQVLIYTPILKRVFLIKNISCACLISFSIFFNGLAAAGNTLLSTNKNFGLLGIALSFIFFGSWSNELILDMRDIEGDNNNNIVTIPTLFGNNFSWLLVYTINNYNIISNSLSMAYLYNSPIIGSVIVVILSPLLLNLFKVKQEKYSLESLKYYTQKSNYPLLALITYLCGLAYFLSNICVLHQRICI